MEGGKKMKIYGSRRQVMNGKAEMTTGKLRKNQLTKNKHGEIVSKKARKAALNLSPYMKFFIEVRPSVMSQNPEMTFTEIGSKVGRLWRGMDDEEKKQYAAGLIDAYGNPRDPK